MESTPADVEEAWEDFKDIGIVASLVEDLLDDVEVLLNARNTTQVQAEMLKRVTPFLKDAHGSMLKASQTAANMGLFAAIKGKNQCKKCGTTLKGGRCTDETCPYSDHPQSWDYNTEAE